MREFSPLEVFEGALRNWWLIVLLTVWGGLVGWGIHRFQPPVYEARAVFSIGLNFSQTGRLTQFEEDQAWNTMESVFRSTHMMERVAERAQAEQISISPVEFQEMATAERKQYIFDLRVRHPDPRLAASLVNLWAEESNLQLDAAHGHALAAQSLQRFLNSLEDCLGSAPANPPGANLCSLTSLTELQSQMQQTGAALQAELIASREIIPALTYKLSEKAAVPTQPVAYGRSSLVLAGALIGFILGIFFVRFQVPVWFAQRLRHA